MEARVIAVGASAAYSFSKALLPCINLLEGLGVAGDVHSGITVKHRSRVKQDPHQPNLRQVHLMHAELFDQLAEKGFAVAPGQLGENITTRGLDLLALPLDTELQVGEAAIIRVTGLRNPCKQIDAFQTGLMAAVLARRADGTLIRKAGIMGVVVVGGPVRPGDMITAKLPAVPHRALEPV